MKTAELEEILVREGYDHHWYSFDRERPPIDGFILEKVEGRWTIYYFERGATREIARFESEFDACEFFYRRMHEDFGSAVGRAKH